MATVKTPKIFKDLPPKEICWMKQTTESGTQFYTTSNKDRSAYMLYQQTPDGFLLLYKASSPADFNNLVEDWKLKHEPQDEEPKPKRARKSKK